MKGKIVDIFSSYQGEGVYIGVKQLFIRFADCNLACDYCDTNFSEYKEYSLRELEEKVASYLENESFHSISITGGEPLLHSAFLKEFLPKLKHLSQQIFLETNGTLPESLLDIIDWVDIVAVDFKCNSDGRMPFLDKHRTFLEIASARTCFVKMVIPPLADMAHLFEAVDIIEKIDPAIPLVIQPETGQLPLSATYFDLLNKVIAFANSDLKNVRLIPQVHPFLQID